MSPHRFCRSSLTRHLALVFLSLLPVVVGCTASTTPANDDEDEDDDDDGDDDDGGSASSEGDPTVTSTSNDDSNESLPSSGESSESEELSETDDTSASDSTTASTGTSNDSGSESASDTSSGSENTSESDSETESGEEAEENALQILVSVDWEGMNLNEANLRAMESFRTAHPDLPLTHYLNAAYYTKPDADSDEVSAQINRTLRDQDELGLHIHGWRRLFEAAGVTFRSTPTFWGMVDGCDYDCGHQVAISAYETDELRDVIKLSLDTLESHGFTRAVSFRSGGWMGKSNVLAALVAEGIVRDASAVATVHFDDEPWRVEPLYAWLNELWPDTTVTSQPYRLTTAAGEILEIPDNGGLADYVTGDEMLAVYQSCVTYKQAHPKEHVTMNFGFHQETAASYIDRVTDGLAKINAAAKNDGIVIVPVTSQTMKVSP